jgi:hypothetical protein
MKFKEVSTALNRFAHDAYAYGNSGDGLTRYAGLRPDLAPFLKARNIKGERVTKKCFKEHLTAEYRNCSQDMLGQRP